MPRVASTVRVVILTAIAALAVHLAVIAIKTYTHPSHSILAVFRIGELAHDGTKAYPDFVTREGYPLEKGGYGTDGQQYLFAAHDPLLRTKSMVRFIDAPRYRYGRIALPALAATVCRSESACIPRAFVALNALLAAGLGAIAALLVAARRGHPAWGLLIACTGGLICSTDIAGVEVGAQFFALLGVYAVSKHRTFAAVAAFAVATLFRESYALVPAGFAAAALFEKRWRDVVAFGSSVTPAVAWAAFLRRALPPDTKGGGLQNLSPPFFGVIDHIKDFVRHPNFTGHTFISIVVGAPFLAIAIRHLVSLRREESRRDPLALSTAFYCALALVSSSLVWASPGGFARGLDFIYPGVVLCALARGDRLTAWLAVPTLAHTLNIIGDHVFVAPR